MKKIFKVLIVMILLVTCGCNKQEQEEIKPEPLYYSETIKLVSKLETIEELKGKTIAIQNSFDKEYGEYVLEQLNEAGLTEYEVREITTYAEIKPLIDNNEIDAWVLPYKREDTVSDFRSDYVASNYHVLGEYKKPYYEEIIEDTSLYVSELYDNPFIVYLGGLDTFGDTANQEWAKNNNDANHIIVVNPKLRHVLIVSVPRDTYIKNLGNGRYDKLTSLCRNSPMNICDSLSEFLNTDIKHYCLTSFTWFVKGINYFGGVEVDVPMDVYMNMNSERNVTQPWSVPKGEDENLYGEYALALARNRKYNGIVGGDFGRIRNQALIINGLIEKVAYHPYLLEMIGIDWLINYLCENNFSQEEIDTLIALSKTFEEGYTIDNFFIECSDAMINSVYYAKPIQKTVDIAKGKIDLVMNNHIDENNEYKDEILTGYITGGAGTIDVGDEGYIGTTYDLNTIFTNINN